MNSMKRQKDRILKEELPRSVGAQYATGDQWRNNSRKNEAAATAAKSLQSCPTLCDPMNHTGTWNIRSMNQGKLEVVKQEMARVNVNILGIWKMDWNG